MDTDLMKELGIMATEEQLNYIDTLLDQADAAIEDYTSTLYSELTKEEASEIIDAIKEDLGYE